MQRLHTISAAALGALAFAFAVVGAHAAKADASAAASTPAASFDESDASPRADDPGADSLTLRPTRFTTNGCAGAAPAQIFLAGPNAMVGCTGTSTWAAAGTLCSAGWHLCTSAEFAMRVGRTSPEHHYWQKDYLYGSGSGATNCTASVSSNFGNFCPTDTPMRICSVKGDYDGTNYCTWNLCGLESPTNLVFFGGCNAAPAGYTNTAGAVCCR